MKTFLLAAAISLAAAPAYAAHQVIIWGDLTINKDQPIIQKFSSLSECEVAGGRAVASLYEKGSSYYSLYCNVTIGNHNTAYGFYTGSWSIDHRWTK
jgi:hypothetical protein